MDIQFFILSQIIFFFFSQLNHTSYLLTLKFRVEYERKIRRGKLRVGYNCKKNVWGEGAYENKRECIECKVVENVRYYGCLRIKMGGGGVLSAAKAFKFLLIYS